MLIRKGRNIFWCDEDGKEIKQTITDWKIPFGVESYLKKTIINPEIPSTNEALNVRNIISQIESKIENDYEMKPNTPIKNRGNDFLRIEVSRYVDINDRISVGEKHSYVSGTLRFKAYQWKGTWGISVELD